MALLEIRNLHATVEGKEILRGIDLTVNAGEVHSIMGPNGSGKSTLIRTLAGLQSPMAGLVKWNGEDVALISSPRRVSNMAFVQSIPPRQSELTVSEALALHEPNQNKVDDLLDAFNLGEMHMKSLLLVLENIMKTMMIQNIFYIILALMD